MKNAEGSSDADHASASSSSRPRRFYCKRSCQACRISKLSCSDERPCPRCQKRGIECVDVPHVEKPRRRASKKQSASEVVSLEPAAPTKLSNMVSEAEAHQRRITGAWQVPEFQREDVQHRFPPLALGAEKMALVPEKEAARGGGEENEEPAWKRRKHSAFTQSQEVSKLFLPPVLASLPGREEEPKSSKPTVGGPTTVSSSSSSSSSSSAFSFSFPSSASTMVSATTPTISFLGESPSWRDVDLDLAWQLEDWSEGERHQFRMLLRDDEPLGSGEEFAATFPSQGQVSLPNSMEGVTPQQVQSQTEDNVCSDASSVPTTTPSSSQSRRQECFDAVYRYFEAMRGIKWFRKSLAGKPMSPLHQLHFEGLMLLFSERRDAVVKLLGSRPMEGLTHWQLVQRLSNDSTRLPVDKEKDAALGHFMFPVFVVCVGVVEYANDLAVKLLELDAEQMHRKFYWMMDLVSEDQCPAFSKYFSMFISGEISATGVLNLHSSMTSVRSKTKIHGVFSIRHFLTEDLKHRALFAFLPNVQQSMESVVSGLNDPYAAARALDELASSIPR